MHRVTWVQENAALVTAGGVIVGVLLGTALGWVGTWWQSRLAWKRDQAKELNAVAAELLATTLRAWNARNRIAVAVISWVNSERNQNREIMAQADAERMEAFAELREPSVLTAWNLARIQILSPAVGVKARALVEVSDRVVTVEKSLELQAARDSALADFLAAVSAELGVKPAAAAG
jgi:hypothetical protein